MLSLRIITAIVLLVPAILTLFFLSSVWVAAFFSLFVVGGAWEWSALIGMRSLGGRILYTVALVLGGAVLVASAAHTATIVFVIAALWWTLVLVELVRHPHVHEGWLHRNVAQHIAGFLILVPAWVAAYTLHERGGSALLLFALVLVWVADSMAYFSGHVFGRTKLAPTISPGKSVEGVIGGVISVAVLAWLGSVFIWGYGSTDLVWWLVLATVTALYSVLGDLLESKFKRAAGVKDSGKLLPGHGGVLDRIDAATTALPVFALGWTILFGGS